jgi:hypothetical protein
MSFLGPSRDDSSECFHEKYPRWDDETYEEDRSFVTNQVCNVIGVQEGQCLK